MACSARRRPSILVSALGSALVGALWLGLASPGATAQCLGGDALNGACCQPAIPVLPTFTGASIPAMGICWQGCNVASQSKLQVVWATPTQPICGKYTTPLTVIDTTSGLPILTGTLVLDYTRTWDEVDPSGTGHQIWRFTAKADLQSAPGSTALVCPKPNCIAPVGPHATAFYYGYVDYAGCGAAGPYDNVLVLFHNCDRFIHQPGLSDKPGQFHPGSSFGIVAPNTTAQPFVPANLLAPGNPVMGEAVRKVGASGPPVCFTEDIVAQASLGLQGAGCLNTMTANPKQQTLRAFSGTTICLNGANLPGQWVSLNVNFPSLPWFHMVSTSFGSWTNPGVYPGIESAWADEGLFAHRDTCSGNWIELKYGGTTHGGWAAFTNLGPVKSFTDIADNYTAPSGGPYPLPILGSVRPTDHLIYVNQ